MRAQSVATRSLALSVVVTAAALILCRGAAAAPVDCTATGCEVSDNGASMTTDSDEQDLDSLVVDGVDHLHEEEFHINFGVNSAGNPVTDNDIQDELPIVSATQDEDTNQIVVVFSDGDTRVTVTYTLTGGSHTATVGYTAVVTNLTDGTVDLTLVDYVDFDLNDSSSGDVISYSAATMTMKWQEEKVLGTARSVNPVDHFDVGECCEDELYDRVVDGHLADNAGPVGPEDVSGAFQNNIQLGDSGSATLSRELRVVVSSQVAPAVSSGGIALAVAILFAIGWSSLSARKRRTSMG